MEKIYVRLKDTSGSYFIFSQGITVNRNQIVEVDKDDTVNAALLNGVLVESKKSDFEKFTKERSDYFEKQEKADKATIADKKKSLKDLDDEANAGGEKDTAFTEEVAKKLLDSAVEKGKVIFDKDVYKFGKVTLGSQEEAINALLTDEKTRSDIQKAIG